MLEVRPPPDEGGERSAREGAEREVSEAESSPEDSPQADASEPPDPASSPGGEGADGSSDLAARYRNFTFYARGNVRLELPQRQTYIEADELYYENLAAFATARGVRMATSVEQILHLKDVLSGRDVGLATGGRASAGATRAGVQGVRD